MPWFRLALLSCFLVGCAAKGKPKYAKESYDMAPGYVELGYLEEESLDADGFAALERAARPMAPRPPPPPVRQAASMGEPPPEPDADADPDGPERMVHYDGWAQIRTPRAEELVAEVVDLVEEAGGHVETRGLDRVSARVPVDHFDEVWSEVLTLGPVVSRELSADDVTDQFTDLSLRVNTLRATRDRLQELLATATEERDKLELVQQIHRITEQLEVLEARVRTLADLAALSRLTVTAVAPDRYAHVVTQLPAGMGWIDRLSAFDRVEEEALGRPVKLDLPAGFVRLDPRTARFESADGAMVWAFSMRNEPIGDGVFWRQAVLDRIGEQLDDGATSRKGGWALVRFVEQGAQEPYVWHLGFRVDGKHLEVLQVTYPTEVQEARYHDDVLAVLGGGGS